MYNLREIKDLVKMIDSTSIQQLSIEKEGMKLSIRKADPVAAVPQSYVVPQAGAPALLPADHAVVPAASATRSEEVAEEAAKADDLYRIESPMVGTFYAASSPDSPPYVQAGDTVTEKTIVCIVEAMKLMNELEAEVEGKVVEVLVENGQLVEYGQPLFLVQR